MINTCDKETNTLALTEKTSLKESDIEKEEIKRIQIDEILDQIGYTRYHIMMIIIVGLSLASDGIELYLVYLLSPVLKEIYGLSDNKMSIVVSALLFGLALGALTSGVLINKYGRRNTIIFFLVLNAFFGTFCIVIDDIYWFVFCRFIIGISIGVLFNLTNALCEILPSKYRDFIMGSIYVYLKLGIVYFVIIFYLYTAHTDPIYNYKYIVITSCIPTYICLILSVLYYDESPRILLLCNETQEEGFNVILKISVGSKYNFTENDKKGILQEFKILRELNKDDDVEAKNKFFKILRDLFQKKYFKLFFMVICLWIINCTIVFTNLYALPIMLHKISKQDHLNYLINHGNLTNEDANKLKNKNFIKSNNITVQNSDLPSTNENNSQVIKSKRELAEIERKENCKKLLISNLIPVPAEFLTGVVTSLPILGRKYTMSLGFFMEVIFSLLMFLHAKYLYIYSSMISFANCFSFNICKLYTTEAFQTKYRDTAYGFSNFIGRIVATITPIFANLSFMYFTFGPCVIMTVAAFLGVIISISLPFDTYNRPLDKEYSDSEVPK